MSNGNCTDHCRDEGTFAFAVIKYQDCYCSDLIPREQTDVSKCRKVCPGYGVENCGSIDDGLYIYIQNGSPSGTAPGPSSAKPTQQPTVSSSAPRPPPPPPPRSSTPAPAPSSSSATTTTVSALFRCVASTCLSFSLSGPSCNCSVRTLSFPFLDTCLTFGVALTGDAKSNYKCAASEYGCCAYDGSYAVACHHQFRSKQSCCYSFFHCCTASFLSAARSTHLPSYANKHHRAAKLQHHNQRANRPTLNLQLYYEPSLSAAA
jgi:hypothetical protein